MFISYLNILSCKMTIRVFWPFFKKLDYLTFLPDVWEFFIYSGYKFLLNIFTANIFSYLLFCLSTFLKESCDE